MHVVWHDDMCIHGHPMKMRRDLVPKPIRDDAPFIEHHDAINYLAQHAFVFVRADGDEIHARLGVIVLRQTNGTTVMFVWIVRHIQPVGAGSPRPVAPSIAPPGSRQNHRSPSRTAGRGNLRPYIRHVPRRGGVAPPGRPVIHRPVRGRTIVHRHAPRGEETYAPTSVMCHVGAGSPRPVAPSIAPSGSRQNHRSPSRTARARRPTPLHPPCAT